MSPKISVINSCVSYTNQTSSTCAGVCACNRTHQIEKTDGGPKIASYAEMPPMSTVKIQQQI